MSLRRLAGIGVLLALVGLLLAGPVWAEGGLTLSLHRVVGGQLGKQCQGRFTLAVGGVEGITAVTYEIDGVPMATVTQAPFSLTFDTGRYPLGVHRLGATAETAGGRVESNVVEVEFVSASNMLGWILPVTGVILAIALLASVVPQLLGGRGKQRFEPGAVHDYGALGGTICPRCGRPFALSLLGINLLTGKLQRCPYCGKWSVLRRASPQELAAAEAEAAAGAKPATASAPLSEEEKLRRQIDDSRYQE